MRSTFSILCIAVCTHARRGLVWHSSSSPPAPDGIMISSVFNGDYRHWLRYASFFYPFHLHHVIGIIGPMQAGINAPAHLLEWSSRDCIGIKASAENHALTFRNQLGLRSTRQCLNKHPSGLQSFFPAIFKLHAGEHVLQIHSVIETSPSRSSSL